MRRLVLVIASLLLAAPSAPQPRAILVYSGTTGYRHDSIPAGIEAVRRLASKRGLAVEASEDPAVFSPQRLARFRLVVLLSSTTDPKNPASEWLVGAAGRGAARVRRPRRRHRRHPCGGRFALPFAVVRPADRRPLRPAPGGHAERPGIARQSRPSGQPRPAADRRAGRRMVLLRRLRSALDVAGDARPGLDRRARRQPQPGRLGAPGGRRAGVLHGDGPHHGKLLRTVVPRSPRRGTRLGAGQVARAAFSRRASAAISAAPAQRGSPGGASPSGKAPVFGTGIRRFESCRPSQRRAARYAPALKRPA